VRGRANMQMCGLRKYDKTIHWTYND
jgi:hypothetical protein